MSDPSTGTTIVISSEEPHVGHRDRVVHSAIARPCITGSSHSHGSAAEPPSKVGDSRVGRTPHGDRSNGARRGSIMPTGRAGDAGEREGAGMSKRSSGWFRPVHLVGVAVVVVTAACG